MLARMSLTSHEEIGRVGRGSSQRCHEDATRKTVPWNLSYTGPTGDLIALIIRNPSSRIDMQTYAGSTLHNHVICYPDLDLLTSGLMNAEVVLPHYSCNKFGVDSSISFSFRVRIHIQIPRCHIDCPIPTHRRG